MSGVEQRGPPYTSPPDPPDSEPLHRLIIEAAKYTGATVGETIPASDVVEQGAANGYSRDEVYTMLSAADLPASGPVEVPPQGDVFGDLWPGPGESECRTAGAALHKPEDEDEQVPEHVEDFREWLSDKRAQKCKSFGGRSYQFKPDHAYSYQTARKRLARLYDVGEYFCRQYPRYTTVLLTYRADRPAGDSIADHAERFYPAELSRARWNVVNRKCGAEQWAGVRLLAPSLPGESEQRTAGAALHKPQTHGHTLLWLSGHHSQSDFESLRETFVEHVPVANAREQNPPAEAIQVRRHYVNQSENINRITSLASEAASNMPLLRAKNGLRERNAAPVAHIAADASDCPGYVEHWLAALWKAGVRRYHPLGDFTVLADQARDS